MSYISHNAVIVYRPRSCSNTNRVLSSITLLAFQGISLFYTPCQTAMSGMSPVQSVSHVPGLHHRLAQRVSAGKQNANDIPKRRRCDTPLLIAPAEFTSTPESR